MDGSAIADVVRLALESGVSEDVFSGWAGGELALYQDTVGRSSSPDVAARIATEKAGRRDWVLDLGHRAVVLPRAQGELLQNKLEQAGISYSTGDLGDVYLRRVERVARDHEAILRELAKR